MTHFPKCDLFLQVWPTFENVTYFPRVTHFCKCNPFFFKCKKVLQDCPKLLNFRSSFEDNRSLIFAVLASTEERMWLKSSGDKTVLRMDRVDSNDTLYCFSFFVKKEIVDRRLKRVLVNKSL